jgi:hypothetical protein
MNLNLKTLLKATAGCILLTLGWFFCIRPLPVRIDCLREFELIAVFSILFLGWIVYFLKL